MWGGQSWEWGLKAWEAPVDFELSFLIVFIFAKYIGFLFSEKNKLHDYPDFFLVSIQRYYFLLWALKTCLWNRYFSLSESKSTSRIYCKWQSAFRGMSKLCAKQAARKRACERLLSRTSLAKTSHATSLNLKCNGCHFSKCSSQCCGVILVLNNSKVVMIKISFTLISWLLIVLTISSSPAYALLTRRSGDKPGAPNENMVQNHLNITLLNVF